MSIQHIADHVKKKSISDDLCLNIYGLKKLNFILIKDLRGQHEHEGTSDSVMVCKLDKQTFTSQVKSHWVPHSYSIVPHPSKKLSKLLTITMNMRL